MKLLEPGWTPRARDALERLIEKGAGKNLPVTFDFDNTIACGDIGEATLALLTKNGTIRKDEIPPVLAPDFLAAGGKKISLRESADITVYYEELLGATAQDGDDPAPLSSGYLWAVEIMQGLTVLDVVRATAAVHAMSESMAEKYIEVTPGVSAYPVPFIFPEMMELLAALLDRGYDAWIVSASNAWTIRWMAHNVINPGLARRDCARRIEPDRVIGVSTLMRDREGRLRKDRLLVRGDRRYAAMEEERLAGLAITSKACLPASIYSGKVTNIMDVIGARPYLAAGDSPGDLPMLAYAENRLWLARLEKPEYQRELAATAARSGGPWMVQPVLCKKAPGFVRDAGMLNTIFGGNPEKIAGSLEAIRKFM
ncbi:MAG: hypothetical protein EPN93_05710 [Spirochaetes bacterium]|nr:MAG: hypothetical protein EPN93_05710 [Spirochaetota bacterium]